jgi:hypothetical protein
MTSPDPGQSPGTEPKRKTGSGTIRRYTFRTEMDTDEKAALNMLSAACINHWWYTEAAATGHPLVFTFVTVGRDQWWCHRRAIDLAINVVYASGGKDANHGSRPVGRGHISEVGLEEAVVIDDVGPRVHPVPHLRGQWTLVARRVDRCVQLLELILRLEPQPYADVS